MESSEPHAVPASVFPRKLLCRRLHCAANSNVPLVLRKRPSHGGGHFSDGIPGESPIASLILFGSSAAISIGALATMFDSVWTKIARELLVQLPTGFGL